MRFPENVYGKGVDPDVRFSLANERTFLAWIRTSLAFGAAAAAIHTPIFDWPVWVRMIITIALMTAAIVCLASSWARWRQTEIAMRTGTEMPGFAWPFLLVITVSFVFAGVIALSAVYSL